jgi:hypothetical protein
MLESVPWHRHWLIPQVPPAKLGNIYLAVAINLQCLLLVLFAIETYLQLITSTEDRQYKPHFPKNSYVS